MIDSKIKIVSDGTYEGTRLVHLETGEHLANCAGLVLSLDGRQRVTGAKVYLAACPVELEATVRHVAGGDIGSDPIPVDDPFNVIYLDRYLKEDEHEEERL